MEVIKSLKDLRAVRGAYQGITGLVPTMGYLHKGHTSLVEISRQHCEHTIVSLFVNPTQFGEGEDYESYPRDTERDLAICDAAGVDVVFAPPVEAVYMPDASVTVVESALSREMCGVSRPHHFGGVCTVVAKLFNMVQPDIAVFGQKDAQQLAIIRRMVRDLNFPVKVMAGPIIREADGLAMSSRNAYLSDEERQRALSLSKGLFAVMSRYAAGDRHAATLRGTMQEALDQAGVEAEYIDIRDANNLHAIEDLITGPTLVAVAATVGRTRLIDNIVLGTRLGHEPEDVA